MLKNQKISKKININKIHPHYKAIYNECLNYFINYNKNLINEILRKEKKISIPVNVSHIEGYLSGYKFKYIPFNPKKFDTPKLYGFFDYCKENNEVSIFFNISLSQEAIRHTITHELFHFIQFIDIEFQSNLNELINRSLLHRDVICLLLEETTDMATAIYLMPEKYFYSKYNKNSNIKKIAKVFNVSDVIVNIRLRTNLQSTQLIYN